MTTVWIYVDTRYYPGHPDHIKVFANPVAADEWFKENDPEGAASNMRSWSECARPTNPVMLFHKNARNPARWRLGGLETKGNWLMGDPERAAGPLT